MLIDTLEDRQVYHKSTLVEVLREIKKAKDDIAICSSYKTIMRREKQGVPVYMTVTRDPVNGWRMYTGKQIRQIVTWELERKGQ